MVITMVARLREDFTTTVFECQPAAVRTTITIPAGTLLTLVKNASGTEGDLYAVASVKLLVELTRNNHDPYHRYVYVPTEKVAVDQA